VAERALPSLSFRLGTAWALFLLATGVISFEDWWTSYTTEPLQSAATVGIGLLILGLVWAGLWALGNRVFGHPFRFGTHLGTFSLWLLVFTPVWWLANVLHQVVHSGLTEGVVWVLGAASSVILLAAHVRIGGGWRDRWNVAVAVGVVATGGGLGLLAADSDAEGPIADALTDIAPLPAWLYRTGPVSELEGAAAGIVEDLAEEEARRSHEGS
jgi:hypothetical protein